MKTVLSAKLISWLRIAYSTNGKPIDLKDLASILDFADKTLQRLTVEEDRFNYKTLILIRAAIQRLPNNQHGIDLVDAVIALDVKSLWSRVDPGQNPFQKLQHEGISHIKILEAIEAKELPNSLVNEARASMADLYRVGDIKLALDVVERLWHALQLTKPKYTPEVIELGILYSRLLSTSARFDESIRVANLCRQVSTTAKDHRTEAFVTHTYLSAIQKRDTMFDPATLNDDSVSTYLASSDKLSQLISENPRLTRSLAQPLNHCHRGLIVYATRLVGPEDLTPERKNFLLHCAQLLKGSINDVNEDEGYRIANDVATHCLVAAIGDPIIALERADELLSQNLGTWDSLTVHLSKTTALRNIGTTSRLDEAIEILKVCQTVAKERDNTSHYNRIQRARLIVRKDCP